MLAVRPPAHPTPKPTILDHQTSIALRQVGPKSAFLTNRIGNAFARYSTASSRSLVRKKSARKDSVAKVRLKLKNADPLALPKPATSPTPDTTNQPAFRSLSCGPPERDGGALIPVDARDDDDDDDDDDDKDDKVLAVVERGIVPTAQASLAPEAAPDEETERRRVLTLEANSELERIAATDEMRESINEILKGLHASALCTWRQMIGAVILLLMQRKIPMDAIRLLTKERYKVFDVKGLYYGDFLGRWVYVYTDDDPVPIEGTVCAYHVFDGFSVEYLGDDNKMQTIAVGHDTKWAWWSAPTHGDA